MTTAEERLKAFLGECIEIKQEIIKKEAAIAALEEKCADQERELSEMESVLYEKLMLIFIEDGEGMVMYDTKDNRKKIEEVVSGVDISVESILGSDHLDEVLFGDKSIDDFVKDIKTADFVVKEISRAKKSKKKRDIKKKLWVQLSKK